MRTLLCMTILETIEHEAELRHKNEMLRMESKMRAKCVCVE